MQNFAFPYFSRDISEFWRRWHISLSTWFRDYLYIPLGGSRGGVWMKIRNTFIIFIVSGFWHGASWTFVAWGALNALYFLPILLTKNNRKNLDTVAKDKFLPSFKELFSLTLTFSLTVFSWIFFRAEDIGHAFNFISTIFSKSLFVLPNGSDFLGNPLHPFIMFSLLGCFILFEWMGRESQYAIENLKTMRTPILRYATYYAITFAIFWFVGQEQQFIYFQF